ncbi:MAG: hypothetical protein ACTSV2_16900 [Candidatus Thorarchaeota archaeon]
MTMVDRSSLERVVSDLVTYAYNDLDSKRFIIKIAKISSFACITWDSNQDTIRLTCNRIIMNWHEAPIIGLLAHELSHPASKKGEQKEESTDLDVIERGLGSYLAVERIMTNKYTDYVIRKGKDRYLGYNTIRDYLDMQELDHLDRLLSDIRLTSTSRTYVEELEHDYVVMRDGKITSLRNGAIIDNPDVDSDLKYRIHENSTYVYLDDELVAKFDDT